MAMNGMALKNLTLASAKHLMTQGHISPSTHKKIVKKAGGPKLPKMPGAQMADTTSTAFGSLNPVGAGAGHYMGSMPEEG